MRCVSCEGELPSQARFCAFCGVPVGPAVPVAAPAEERKVVTVVFCDLVGSTALSGVLDPETLRTVVLRYFDRMRTRLEQFGGTVEKFIGDAVMAVFGVPVTHEDDARRALAAALTMLDAVHELNETELHPVFGIRIGVRIGVNTGPAVTSTDVSTRQALVAGETVNIAARLEQHAAEGEVLIGPETRRAAGPAARTESVGPLRLKGKAEPVTAYRLLGVGEDDPEVSRRFDVPLVGRTRELGELDQALRDVVDGRGAPDVLVLHGEAGMGKTRLIHEWRKSAAPDHAQGWGRCRPYGEHGSLTPLADALRQLLNHYPDLADLAGIERAAPPVGGVPRRPPAADGHAEAAEALAVLAGGLLEDGTPNPSVDDTCAAVGALLGVLARSSPLVLVVDDCQWAADVLLDMLGALAGDLASSAVLFVCATRPDLFDRRPGWGTTRALALRGLSAAEAVTVADALMEVGAHRDAGTASGVPPHVLEAAGGNPLHLEHLLTALAEHGSGYRADGSDGGELPTTLQALLGARIGALGRAERVTLDLAAVVGREFGTGEVTALAGRDRESAPGGALHDSGATDGGTGPTQGAAVLRSRVAAALARLRRHRLVGTAEEGGGTAGALRFSSGLVHEVTYRSMAKRARAERHEQLAALLAERLPADPAAPGEGGSAEAGATVAGHLEHAYRYRAELGIAGPRTEELRRAAVTRLVESGTQAFARSDLAWAGGLLRRALDLAREGEAGRTTAARRLGEVRLATGHTDEGRSLLRSVLASGADASAGPGAVEIAHARLALAVASAGGAAGEVAEWALGEFERAGDELGQARACIRLAQERQLHGRHVVADALLTRGLGHAERSGAEPERALALGAIGVSLWRGPEPVPQAVARCRDLLARHGERRPTVRLTLNCPLAVLLALQERWDEAYACLTKARRLAEGLGYAEGAVVLPLFHAAVDGLAGDTDGALALLAEAAEAGRALEAHGLLGVVARDSARLLVDAGRIDEAVRQLAAAGGPDGTTSAPGCSASGADPVPADRLGTAASLPVPGAAGSHGPAADRRATAPAARPGPAAPGAVPASSLPHVAAEGHGPAPAPRFPVATGRPAPAGSPPPADSTADGSPPLPPDPGPGTGTGTGTGTEGSRPALAPSDAADLDGLTARIAAAQGRSDEAAALAERAVRTAAGTDSPVVLAVAWLDRSDVLRQSGRTAEARAAADRAASCYEAKGHLPGTRRAVALRVAPAPASSPRPHSSAKGR